MSEAKTVTVTDVQPARRGDGTIIEGEGNYGPWTMWEIACTDETGTPIQEKVKCFKKLPLGEQQLEFDAQDHEQYGRSYTVKPLKGARLPAQSHPDDGYEMMRESIRMLSERVAALETHLGLKLVGSGSDVPAVVQTPVAAVAGALPDDDIPFAVSWA